MNNLVPRVLSYLSHSLSLRRNEVVGWTIIQPCLRGKNCFFFLEKDLPKNGGYKIFEKNSKQ